jgi:hypothetical protein
MQRLVLLQTQLSGSSTNSSAIGNSMLLQQQMLVGLLYKLVQVGCRLQGVGNSTRQQFSISHARQRNAQDHRRHQCSSLSKAGMHGQEF